MTRPYQAAFFALFEKGPRGAATVIFLSCRWDSDFREAYTRHPFVPIGSEHYVGFRLGYQQEAERITREGGTVNRVVLDFELKRSINRKLSTIATLPEANRTHRKQEIATEHGLAVVDGKILVPDLRIEYKDRDHQQTKVDLGLATGHYHRDTIAQKVRAGFAVFREQSQSGRGAEHDHGLMRDVLSL